MENPTREREYGSVNKSLTVMKKSTALITNPYQEFEYSTIEDTIEIVESILFACILNDNLKSYYKLITNPSVHIRKLETQEQREEAKLILSFYREATEAAPYLKTYFYFLENLKNNLYIKESGRLAIKTTREEYIHTIKPFIDKFEWDIEAVSPIADLIYNIRREYEGNDKLIVTSDIGFQKDPFGLDSMDEEEYLLI